MLLATNETAQEVAAGPPAVRRRVWQGLYAAVVVWSGVFVWFVGHRGIFLFDQSMIFDGAWRLLQGQVPYRDFFMPFGPVTFLLQALFFRIAGVDFSSMVLAAAVSNAIATTCVIWIIRRLMPEQFLVPLLAGLLTSVWFQAPFGTLWLEQTSFLFSLLALCLMVRAGDGFDGRRFWLRFTSGFFLAASVLSKQNAGVLFLPVFFVAQMVLFQADWRRALRAALQPVLGLSTGIALFLTWLFTFSSPQQFFHYFIAIPRAMAADRMTVWVSNQVRDLPGTILAIATFGAAPQRERFMIAFCFLVAVVAIIGVYAGRGSSKHARGNVVLIGWIIIGLVLYQGLFTVQTQNEWENAEPYLGLVFGLAFGLLGRLLCGQGFGVRLALREGLSYEGALSRWEGTALFAALAAGMLVVPLYDGVSVSSRRIVQQFYASSFVDALNVPGATRLKWGNPTRVRDYTISRQDFEDVNAWLRNTNATFFVFPDTTILYGLHARMSPQPWLFFERGHSYLPENLLEVDRQVTESLQRNNVRVVVLEKSSFTANHRALAQMPQLKEWIAKQFRLAKTFGVFEVWEHL